MNLLRISFLMISLFTVQLTANFAVAQTPGSDIAEAANNFLAALTPEQKSKAVYELSSDERVNWHFVPMARKGLTFADMSASQKHLAHALLATTLSHRGYFKASTIMSLEQILYEMENQAPRRNADMYYFSVFGTPGKEVWGWRAEGHHLSLNFTLRGETVIAAPTFMGTNPAEIKSGPRKGLRVLAKEEDLGRELVNSLDEKQRSTAIITNFAPRDIITGDSRKAKWLEPTGLSFMAMKPAQQEVLKSLIKEYTGRARAEVAATDWEKIEKAGWNKVSFAWAGGLETGQGHYYRVQGPKFLLEYDNTQNDANHIHAVWRDLENDFGEDLLRKHYDESKHSK